MTHTNNNITIGAAVAQAIAQGKILADRGYMIEGRKVYVSAADGCIYVLSASGKTATKYAADGSKAGNITLTQYNAQVTAIKARREAAKLQESKVAKEPTSKVGKELLKAAEGAKAERERIEAYKKANGEAEADNKHVAQMLDAEREDSKFDYRQAEDVLSRSEADSYEETDSLLDEEEKVDLRGHHKAELIGWENVKGHVNTQEDGSRKEYKPFIRLEFSVNGEVVKSRAYAPQWNSFKIQANRNYRGLFSYMKDSVALDELVGKTFDIWLKWNDLFYNEETKERGEWQADYYDVVAYRAQKAREARVDELSRRGSNSRPTENKATR